MKRSVGVGRKAGRAWTLPVGLIALAAAVVLLAACSGRTVDEIPIDGSSTVGPLTEAVVEEFAGVAPGVRVPVGISGTGGGFEKFCRGETVISNASRPIQQEEVDACAGEGIDDIIEFQVAIDALTVMVNPDNDFVDCLTVQQVHDLFRTDGVSNWREVDPSFPDEGIDFYYPGTDSGTFDYFVEAIIEDVDEDATHRGDGTPSEDDNVLALGIENDVNAIGYFGFSYFQEAAGNLKSVAIDGGAGCFAPSIETALVGDYVPLSRPLLIYTRESFLAERPEVFEFITFYLENSAELVQDVGYVPMPDDLLGEQTAKLDPFVQ